MVATGRGAVSAARDIHSRAFWQKSLKLIAEHRGIEMVSVVASRYQLLQGGESNRPIANVAVRANCSRSPSSSHGHSEDRSGQITDLRAGTRSSAQADANLRPSPDVPHFSLRGKI
jgi:hypothetical protein